MPSDLGLGTTSTQIALSSPIATVAGLNNASSPESTTLESLVNSNIQKYQSFGQQCGSS